MRITNTEQVTLNLKNGPRTFYVSTVQYEDGDEVPGICEWLVPDVADGTHDAVPCEAVVHGRTCVKGHPQVAGAPARNEYAELN